MMVYATPFIVTAAPSANPAKAVGVQIARRVVNFLSAGAVPTVREQLICLGFNPRTLLEEGLALIENGMVGTPFTAPATVCWSRSRRIKKLFVASSSYRYLSKAIVLNPPLDGVPRGSFSKKVGGNFCSQNENEGSLR